ncbi:MAG: hypothetical protein ACPGO3_13670 [Magnetospiraceae bacterium]
MMELNANDTFKQTLSKAQGLGVRVLLHLKNGDTLGGAVGGVSDTHVVLKELSERDFFDAIICVDSICAIEVRARNS